MAAETEPGRVAIRLSFMSGPMAVRAALGRFRAELAPLELPQDALGTIEIVLAEILNKIVEHAYPEPAAPGPIELGCDACADMLNLQIVDEGIAMPGGGLPQIAAPEPGGALDSLPEGGFGWHLIRSLAQDVRYTRCDRRNILDIRLSVGAA
jgi:serine/threonine-protein kinase RsbW